MCYHLFWIWQNLQEHVSAYLEGQKKDSRETSLEKHVKVSWWNKNSYIPLGEPSSDEGQNWWWDDENEKQIFFGFFLKSKIEIQPNTEWNVLCHMHITYWIYVLSFKFWYLEVVKFAV